MTSSAAAVRILIVGDDSDAVDGLRRSLDRLGGALVVASLPDIASAQTCCERGDADVVVIDAAKWAESRSRLAVGEPAVSAMIPLSGSESAGPGWAAGREQFTLAAVRRVASLTTRERQVFALLGAGYSNRQLARTLGITERTVKAHIGSIMTKLCLESRLQVGLAALTCDVAGPGAAPRRHRTSGRSDDGRRAAAARHPAS